MTSHVTQSVTQSLQIHTMPLLSAPIYLSYFISSYSPLTSSDQAIPTLLFLKHLKHGLNSGLSVCSWLWLGLTSPGLHGLFLTGLSSKLSFSMKSLATKFKIVTVSFSSAAKSFQSCLTLCDPINGSPPGSSIHGTFQARVLEWGAVAFSFLFR